MLRPYKGGCILSARGRVRDLCDELVPSGCEFARWDQRRAVGSGGVWAFVIAVRNWSAKYSGVWGNSSGCVVCDSAVGLDDERRSDFDDGTPEEDAAPFVPLGELKGGATTAGAAERLAMGAGS